MILNASRFPLIGALFIITLLAGALLTTLTPASVHGQVVGPNSCGSKTLLFVTSSHSLEPRDEALLNHLTAQGLTVVVRTGPEANATDADGKDLILISESILSNDVNSKFRDVPVPLITWEGWIYDDLHMTDRRANKDYGEQLNENRVRITTPDHPLAAGLTGDVQTLDNTSASADRKFHWGVPSSNASIIATNRKDRGLAYIFAYEKGAVMVGQAAPARRIGLPNASAHHFTAEGWQLFDAAVQWAMACAGNPAPIDTPTVTPTLIQTAPPTAPPTSTETPTPPSPTKTPTATLTERPSATPLSTPSATPNRAEAQVSVTKMDFLYIDKNQDELVSDGDTVLYTLKVTNQGGKSAQLLRLVDAPDPNSMLLTGTVNSSSGVVVKGNSSGDAHVVIEFATVPSGTQAFVSFQAVVKLQSPVANLQNQAVATFSDQDASPRGQKTVVSDDPDTSDGPDTTVTVLNTPLTQISHRLFLPVLQR